MTITRLLSIACVLSLLAGVCCSCSSGDVGEANKTKIDTDAAMKKQEGANGNKARAGGGMMADPMSPKPGEHVGDPGKGAKAGGG